MPGRQLFPCSAPRALLPEPCAELAPLFRCGSCAEPDRARGGVRQEGAATSLARVGITVVHGHDGAGCPRPLQLVVGDRCAESLRALEVSKRRCRASREACASTLCDEPAEPFAIAIAPSHAERATQRDDVLERIDGFAGSPDAV